MNYDRILGFFNMTSLKKNGRNYLNLDFIFKLFSNELDCSSLLEKLLNFIN